MKKGKHSNKNKSNKKIVFLISILVISIIIIFIKVRNTNTSNNEVYKELANDNSHVGIDVPVETKPERVVKLEELQKENSNIVAWLQIEDTNINYPVLQGKDNSYYMTHNYKKEYTIDGSLFLDKDYDWVLPSTNLLIYGHNNRGSNTMFADLMKYKNEDFYNTHKTIRLTTNGEDAEYEIISVFLSRVYYKSEKDVFRYYYFINAENEQEFNEYIQNSKAASLYNIEATAKYGDQLLTLSTCEYSQEDGRLAVVAKKINKGTE